jgi:hypothetical protein
MQQVIYDGKLYDVCDITERCYVVYDIQKGYCLYLPKEECEVV